MIKGKKFLKVFNYWSFKIYLIELLNSKNNSVVMIMIGFNG